MSAARNKDLAADLKLAMLEAAPWVLEDYIEQIRNSQNPEDKRKYLELTHKISMAADEAKPALPVFNITIGAGNIAITQEPTAFKSLDSVPLVIENGGGQIKINAELLADLVADEPPAPEPVDLRNPLSFLDAIAS